MMTSIKPKNREALALVSFLSLVPLVSHLSFSWMGFTPTDEGFTLALSRRILDGQIPHRDFIIIRPFLSPLIHVPFVLFGGDYTFWLSRLFVWFQLSLISWLWVSIINRSLNFPFSTVEKVFVALIAFAATAHTKHLTAWFTIDGLFFATIGLVLGTNPRQIFKLAGYFLLGMAVLCKQSFLFMAPLALFILNDWRQIKYWIAAVLPGLFYLIFLMFVNSVPEAILQLSSPAELASIVIRRYSNKWNLLSVLIGYLAARFTLGRQALDPRTGSKAALLIFYAIPVVGAALSLWRGAWIDASFLAFGLLLGLTSYLLTTGSELTRETQVMCLVLLTAWSVSLSGGYTSPALASGPILAALIGFVFSRFKIAFGRSLSYSLGIASFAILVSFAVGRSNYIYRERPAAELNSSLDGVLRGGKMIYTNPNTHAFMSDLQRAVEFVESHKKEYAILPDVTAYYVTARQENHLPAVWPIAGELSNRKLMNRYIEAMEAQRETTIFILQKVEATRLANGFVPLPDSDYYEVVRYARAHFRKIHETNYFELYN
jgi:hypothetical protein